MVNMNDEHIRQLVSILSGIASYNDKGYIWMGHGEADVERQRQASRAAIDQFIADVGEAEFPEAVLAELRSDKPIKDGSGLVYERIEAQLRAAEGH
jgi:hypothetical protein